MNPIEIEHRRESGVATVWLNRPDKKNAVGFDAMRALVAAAGKLRADCSVRAVVLAGRGGTFCAGIDLADLNNPANRKTAVWELIKPGRSLFQAAALVWQDLPVPVLCAVEGHCLGAGVQLALGADIRFATPQSQWAVLEARWGIVPDMGISRTAQGVVRQDILRELTYSGRVFSGEQAAAYGLVTHLSEQPLAAAYDLAAELAQRSPDAHVGAKRIVQTMQHKPLKTLRMEKIWQLKLLLGKNQRRAVKKDRDPHTEFLPRQFD